ncbi:MAG TPA: hypothetical protein VFB16_07740 [Bauldia sp.]|nr:hypothetical protein [Bauldia sp.]
MSALALTGAGLAAALADIAGRPAVARAVRAKADALAARIAGEAARRGVAVTAETVADGDGARVIVAGPDLFAREFGSLGKPANPLVAEAIAAVSAGG